MIGQATCALLLSLLTIFGSTGMCMMLTMPPERLPMPLARLKSGLQPSAFMFCSNSRCDSETCGAYTCVETPHGLVQVGDGYDDTVQILQRDAWFHNVCIYPWQSKQLGRGSKGVVFLYGSRHNHEANVLFMALQDRDSRKVIAEFRTFGPDDWSMLGNQCWSNSIWASRWTRQEVLVFVGGLFLMLARFTYFRYAGYVALVGLILTLGASYALVLHYIAFGSI